MGARAHAGECPHARGIASASLLRCQRGVDVSTERTGSRSCAGNLSKCSMTLGCTSLLPAATWACRLSAHVAPSGLNWPASIHNLGMQALSARCRQRLPGPGGWRPRGPAAGSAQPQRERAASACVRRPPRCTLSVQAGGGRAQATRWRPWAASARASARSWTTSGCPAWATASARRCRRCWRPPRWARCARCAAPTRRAAWQPPRATRGSRAGCSPTYRARPASAGAPPC